MKGVTADVTLNGTGFHDQDGDTDSPSKVVVAKEAVELEKLQKRLSVRDLATQFESGQAAAKAAASKLADEEVELLFINVISIHFSESPNAGLKCLSFGT